jgi:hypothetical protein
MYFSVTKGIDYVIENEFHDNEHEKIIACRHDKTTKQKRPIVNPPIGAFAIMIKSTLAGLYINYTYILCFLSLFLSLNIDELLILLLLIQLNQKATL